MELLREEYLEYLSFGQFERPLFVELFGPLIGLEDEWKAQGACDDELDLTGFGFDYVRRHNLEINTGVLGGYKPCVLEETDEYRITRDELGRTMKLVKSSATIPLPLSHPVTDMDSWLKVKPFYEFSEDRFAGDWEAKARTALKENALICFGFPGGFDEPRQLLGEENLCYAYYEQPELIHDILRTIAETTERIIQRIVKVVPIDQLSIHEDMAGKSGSLVGPNIISDFIRPYYRRIWDLAADNGTNHFRQDSDGNMNSVIDAFLECGVTEMFPMEPAAGMDIVQIREKYGTRLAMSGGIDKHVLRKSKEDIVKELEYKLQPKMREGGMVFGLDHRIPNGTPLENYRFYVRTAREILGLEPDPKPGWARMAF